MKTNPQNGICPWLLLAGLALAGCQDKPKVIATPIAPIECRERPPASEMEAEASSSHYGMSYGGFQLGQSAREVEDRIAQHQDWMVSRADCNGSWQVRAGTVEHGDNGTACRVHGKKPCELVMAGMQRATTGPHVLTDLTYVQRLEGNGRPTQEVLDELTASYGEPAWSYAARRSPGWPKLTEKTQLIWAALSDNTARREPDSNFEEQVIHQLGAGDYLIVTLIHNPDHKVTSAMSVDLRKVRPESIPDRQTTRGSK